MEAADTLYDRIFGMIALERARQIDKWGDDRGKPPILMATILAEECGEVARAALHRDRDQLREEAIQVAAVACSIIAANMPDARPARKETT